ncbi:MAG: hypothetical protein ACLQVG_00300 [Terriglobia bacterium]
MLINRQPTTERQRVANRQNGNIFRESVQDEPGEPIGAALRRLGYSSDADEEALSSLGEDPIQFQNLLEGLWKTYSPADAAQEGLVIRLARATRLDNRIDRMLEGCTVRRAQDVNLGRKDRRHAQMMRLKMMADTLRLLAQSVEREHFVTCPADLEKMKSLQQEGALKEMGEIAIALFLQLQPPGTGKDGMTLDDRCREAAARMEEIFGLRGEFAPPPGGRKRYTPSLEEIAAALPGAAVAPESGDKLYPKITPAEWEARERPRQLLENILKRQVEACEQQRKALLRESVKGPSPYERAAEFASTDPMEVQLRKMQDSYFREIRRVTNMILKLKRHQQKMKTLEAAGSLERGKKSSELKKIEDPNRVQGA